MFGQKAKWLISGEKKRILLRIWTLKGERQWKVIWAVGLRCALVFEPETRSFLDHRWRTVWNCIQTLEDACLDRRLLDRSRPFRFESDVHLDRKWHQTHAVLRLTEPLWDDRWASWAVWNLATLKCAYCANIGWKEGHLKSSEANSTEWKAKRRYL